MFSAGLRANGTKSVMKKKKRKSPYQLMALENIYNEHKYPSDEMKAEVAEEIGLSEKQVSMWFYHRRVKDKGVVVKDEGNNIGGRDRSSQGLGSGHHQQDSCGSTKQTGYENPKPRGVESQRLYEASYQIKNVDGVDRSSSECSSSSHGHHLVSNNNGVCDVSHNRAITPLSPQVVQSYVHKLPSGYLKVKRVTGYAAITSVKRLLGRHYNEDGPPLAVHFDPLPHGAFESPTENIVQEPICFGNQRRSYCPYVTGDRWNSNPASRYGAHNTKIYSLDPYLDVDNDDIMVGSGSGFRDKQNHQEPRPKPSTLNYYGSFTDQNSLEETHIGSSRDIPLSSKKSWISPKHIAEGVNYESEFRIDQMPRHDSTAEDKSGYFTKPSNPVPLGGCRLPDTTKRSPPSRMGGKYYGEKNHVKMHRDVAFNRQTTSRKTTETVLSSTRLLAERDTGSGRLE